MNVRRVRQAGVWSSVVLALSVHAQAAKYPLIGFQQLQGVVACDVLQDSSGSIWLATDRGLWRWSNEAFVPELQHFPTVNPTECLVENRQVLWVGTANGVVGVDLASMTSLPGPPQLEGVQVHRMVRDTLGRVWCATTQGLYRLRMQAGAAVAGVVPRTNGRDIRSVAIDSQGVLWAGTRGVLLRYDGDKLTEHFEEVLAGRAVCGLAVGREGALWIGLRDSGGLYKYEGWALSQVLPQAGEEAPEVNVIMSHPDGEVWIGTERGVLRWTGREFIRIDRTTGLTHEAVLGLYVDREELVWIATRGGGVFQLRSPHVLTYDVYDGLPHPVVQVVFPCPNGEFIVGMAAGLCRMNAAGHVVQGFRYPGSVEALYVGDDGRLWAGGRDGLACFDEQSGERLQLPDLQSMRDVTAIGPHDANGVWVCSATGLWRIEGDKMVRVFPSAEPTEHGIRVNGMVVGPEGTVYLATQTGVWRHGEDGRWMEIAGGRQVFCLASDPQGRLWIGTSQGLMTFEGEYCQDFYRRGSPLGNVTDITVDHQGVLWLATPEGVSRFDGRRFTTFGSADGLPGDEVYCVTAPRPRVLFVGTSQGLARLESDRISVVGAPPLVEVTGFKAGGEQYVIRTVFKTGGEQHATSDPALRIPNWQNNVSINFQEKGFRQDQRRLRYLSRLVGFEDEWSVPSPEPGRSYTNLPWGDYEFQVKGRDSRGVVGDRIASVSFAIGPPVWLNPWFVAGCTIALSALSAWVLATQRNKRRLQRAAEAATVAKSEFLAKVSHEIRTPLTVILGCTERLAEAGLSRSGMSDSVDAICRNSTHLLDLINDLLDLSKIEAGHLNVDLKPASVPEILMGVDAIMRVNAEQHGLDFRIVYETEIPELIVTDPGRLRQALINLVGNAIKFTPEGHVRIRVHVDDGSAGRWLVFDIEDTGVGIPAEKTDVIFDAFGQAESFTERKTAGTGLGLAITKSVGERLYGRLTVQSEVGRGSTFTLAVDLSKACVETVGMETRMVSPAELAAERAPALSPEAGRGGEPVAPALCGHILLAEDAPDISNIMRVQLESAGARVTVVDTGPDAVETAHDGCFDAIIMDIHIPGMDGISATRELRDRGIETPIIVISADSSEERRRQCTEAGADGFVPKPFQKIPFLTEIRRHLKEPPDGGGHDVEGPIRSDLDVSSPRMAAAVAEFVRTLDQRVMLIEGALERRDMETIARLAHQLKGAGGINGYMCVSDKAREIEESLARGDGRAVQAAFGELRRITGRIIAGLRPEEPSTGAARSD